ncbi:unnamed protein product [Ceratitis capitata]|uniref:(Mediterranean fruit fly) hypothetical protein n=1 Tax=Ceratitis capitata TaxID=7213 RepID=A0A811UTW8_CERCA|nr:unnamed protein product [Ceratitis capitata]
MQRFICAIFSMLALVHASPYGSSSGSYGGSAPAPAPAPAPYSSGQVVISYEPPVLYNIPAPTAWNLSPRHAGAALTPVNARTISGDGTPGSLVGISSQPSAAAAAASANVPLNAGSYKLWVVPSYEVPNVVGPTSGYAGQLSYGGGQSYGAQAPAAPSYGAQSSSY